MKVFTFSLRVYIEDTDAVGIVYYANYLKYMERSRTEFLRELGFPKPVMPAQGKMLVVRSSDVSYLAPAALDDCLEVQSSIQSLRKTYMVLNQQVTRDGKVLVQGINKIACISKETMKPTAMPANMQAALHEWL